MGVFSALGKQFAELGDTLRMKPIQAFIWFCCWLCWTYGSMGFYFLPFTLSNMATGLHVAQSKISEANTTSMLSRTIGAAIFGVMSDQLGRKWVTVIDVLLIGVFTLCNGFVKTYGQLVGVRFLFGVAYGGLYGLIMSTVLEATPRRARGIVAGFTQQGFSAGYLFASALHLAMSKYKWEALFWLGAGLCVVPLVIRLITPFYSVTVEAVQEAEGLEHVDSRTAVGGRLSSWAKFKFVIRYHWPALVYATVLTACFNTFGHGAMDLYPTFLVTQKKLHVLQETYVTCILQIGGILGGVTGGYLSKYSPKYVAAGFALAAAPWLPLWVLPSSWHLLALGAFFLQFCYGAAIGNLGNILQQLCPHPGFRGAFTGVSYNLGNAISSVAPTIETKLGEDFPLKGGVPDYGRTQMILVGIMIGLLTLVLVCMPLNSLNTNWDAQDPNMEIPEREVKPLPMEAANGGKGAKTVDGKAVDESTYVEEVK